MSKLLPAYPAYWAWLPAAQCATSGDLYHWQQGRCAICGEPAALQLDHDHGSGLVRGWLCDGCNTAEGKDGMKDHPVFLVYRVLPPAAICGLTVRFVRKNKLRYLTSAELSSRRARRQNPPPPNPNPRRPARPKPTPPPNPPRPDMTDAEREELLRLAAELKARNG